MPDTTPTQRAAAWLASLDAALSRNDAQGAAELFDADCYWRDLVAFTWNIKTAEGKAAIADMLKSTSKEVAPKDWKLTGEATEADGITEGWFTFETKLARGLGHVRLKGDKAWTLLTTAQELKGFEEKKGKNRWFGTEHGVF
ncbi:MAG: NAD(P)/FAD-dependent oxidoreductase, partial [Dongia sp.]